MPLHTQEYWYFEPALSSTTVWSSVIFSSSKPEGMVMKIYSDVREELGFQEKKDNKK